MKVNIGTYSFGGIASYLGLGPTLLEKFQTIKSLGYDGVELLPVDLDNDVEDIKKWAEETGLEIVSIHAKPTEEIVKKMAALGAKAVIWAGTDFCDKEEAIALAKELDQMAEMAEPYGIKIGYHNHSKEFYMDEGPAPAGPRDGEFQQMLPAAGLRLGHERRHLSPLLHPQV